MAPHTSANLLQLLLLLLALFLRHPTPAAAGWKTLTGQAPVVIANGGDSGLYPDQTSQAYIDALGYSLPGVAISCDLQMAPTSDPTHSATGLGICKTGLNLYNSTNIAQVAPQLNSTRTINGISTFGWFAVDIPFEDLTNTTISNITATQSVFSRTSRYDSLYPITDSRAMPYFMTGFPNSTWWLNSEYTRFTEENSNLNATSFLLGLIQGSAPGDSPGYVSVPEIGLLERIQVSGVVNQTKVIYKFLDSQTADASTNQTYEALKQNLTYIKTLASGILVPKSYIWPIDPNTSYLQTPTTLVVDAHNVGLEVYAYNFANDEYPNSYNYSFDPITEILYYIETYNFSVDGFFTDFPLTASEAISCYSSNTRIRSLEINQTIQKSPILISHDGSSGQLPAATTPAYYSAINAGVDYIDCNVQISKDGTLVCRPTVNLLDSTDVSKTAFFPSYTQSYPGLYGGELNGIFTFNLTWGEISSLRATIYSPEAHLFESRTSNFDGEFNIITLVEFLRIARDNSIGVVIGIQNAAYIRDHFNLAVVDAVAQALYVAGYNVTDNVILRSEDSSALARLRDFNVTYPMMYEILYDTNNPISLNANDFVEIKKYASSVAFSARVVEPMDSTFFFLTKLPTDVIALAHDQNLTTFFEVQKNEYVALPNDFVGDPTLELNFLLTQGIDGIITDFPSTVKRFFSNQCLGNNGFPNGLNSTVSYGIPLIIPAGPQLPPGPLLVVEEPALLGVGVPPALSPTPASSSQILTHLLFTALSAILYLLIIVV